MQVTVIFPLEGNGVFGRQFRCHHNPAELHTLPKCYHSQASSPNLQEDTKSELTTLLELLLGGTIYKRELGTYHMKQEYTSVFLQHMTELFGVPPPTKKTHCLAFKILF